MVAPTKRSAVTAATSLPIHVLKPAPLGSTTVTSMALSYFTRASSGVEFTATISRLPQSNAQVAADATETPTALEQERAGSRLDAANRTTFVG
jgi:hypothetical protein